MKNTARVVATAARLCLLQICLGAALPAQDGPAGTHARDLQRFLAALDQAVPVYLEDFAVPGTAVAVIRNGEIVFRKGYGHADAGGRVAVTPATGFNVGSISKTVAAWGVMRLVQRGDLELDAPIESFLTRWQLPPSQFDASGVTVRRLLSHTAGLSLSGYPGFGPDDPLPSLEASLAGATNGSGDVRIVLEPGTRWQYSGGGYTLLQLLVEEVTGLGFADYMRDEVLRPLGMSRSGYRLSPAILAGSSMAFDELGEPTPSPRFTAQAAAGLHTTADDLARFAVAALASASGELPGRGLLDPATIALMSTPAPASPAYGLGYGIQQIGTLTWAGHGGSNHGWQARFMIVPATGDGLVVVTNGTNGGLVVDNVACDWTEWLTGARPDCPRPAALAVIGTLRRDGIDAAMRRYAELEGSAADGYDFDRLSVVALAGLLLQRDRRSDAAVVFDYLVERYPEAADRYRSAVAAYSADRAPVVPPQLLARYAGEYEVSPELRIVVRFEDDRLRIRLGDSPELEVHPLSDQVFLIQFSSFFTAEARFDLDDDGDVAGMTLEEPRSTRMARKVRAGDADRPRAVANDQRRSAGRLVDGELRVELEAVEADWLPRGADGPRFATTAFAEAGGPPQVPGPLIRAPAGTPIRVSVRNTLDRQIAIRGLLDRASMAPERPPGSPAIVVSNFPFADSLIVPAGETREVRFTASAEVSSFYYGRVEPPADARAEPGFVPGGFDGKGGIEGAFLGALVVDPPGAGPPPDERVLVITRWASVDEPGSPGLWRMFINGLSWPFTERLEYTVGDTVRWRVINTSIVDHPMHLHGFYFRVDARGDGDRDTVYAAGEQTLAVTEWMPELSSLRLTWVPEEPGNWLFHCHLVRHMGPLQRFAADGDLPEAEHDHDMHHMAGMVLGITVRPPPGWQGHDPPAARRIDLWTGARPGVVDGQPALAFVTQDGPSPPAPDSIVVPSSPLVLRRGEPTEIVVHNRFDFAISVHWHGLELRSLYDGVGHWSGVPGAVRPPIPPGASKSVRITPPRAGSFMYHIHGEAGHELAQGLYGPFLVLGPGEVWDRERDRVFLLAARGASLEPPPVINGHREHPPERVVPGLAYRLRFLHISADDLKEVRLLRDGEAVAWTPLAKDGADLPPRLRVPVPATARLGVGETADFEWAPDGPGVYVLEVVTRFFPSIPSPPALQRVAFGAGDVSDEALLAAAFVEPEPEEPPAIELSPAELRRFVGTYTGAETVEVQQDDAGLRFQVAGGPANRLIAIGPALFRVEAVRRLRFHFELDGERAAVLVVTTPAGDRIRLPRRE